VLLLINLFFLLAAKIFILNKFFFFLIIFKELIPIDPVDPKIEIFFIILINN